jgi:hypothetical protein
MANVLEVLKKAGRNQVNLGSEEACERVAVEITGPIRNRLLAVMAMLKAGGERKTRDTLQALQHTVEMLEIKKGE